MKDYGVDIAKLSTNSARELWHSRLERLSPERAVSLDGWVGEFFSKQNPLWQRYGIVKPSGHSDAMTVLNSGGTRAQMGRIWLRTSRRGVGES